MHRRAGLVAPHRGENGAVVAEVLAGIRRSRVDAPDKGSTQHSCCGPQSKIGG